MGLQSVSKTLVIDDIIGVQSSKFTNVVGMLTRRKSYARMVGGIASAPHKCVRGCPPVSTVYRIRSCNKESVPFRLLEVA